MTKADCRQRNFRLVLGIVIALAAGVMVTISGFVLTLLYLFTSGHLHTAPPTGAIYLIAPAAGALIALIGLALVLRNWLKSRL